MTGDSARPLLILGASGQVGTRLLSVCRERAIATVGFSHKACDIADAGAVEATIGRVSPRLVVNCAAFTAVDRAESEQDIAYRANRDGAGIVALAAARRGLPLVHLSTDYVFDGRKGSPYREDDAVAAISVYGKSKEEGEGRIREANPRHVILRVAWIFDPDGRNFLKTILRLAGEREMLRVADDQTGSPTAAIDIAEAVLAVDRAIVGGASPWGTYHFAGGPAANRFDFAVEILACRAAAGFASPRLERASAGEFPLPASRPPNSALDCSRFAGTFGYSARPWRERVAETVATVLGKGASGVGA